MDLNQSQSQNHGANELFRAQSHIYKHALGYANSFCLNCALQLGIPDIIHKHNHPMSHPELVSALQLPPEKSRPLHRLMSLLVHLGFFSTTKIDSNQEEEEEEQQWYVLTPSSKLLLSDEITNLSPLVRATVDPAVLNPWRSLGDWFLGNEQSQLTVFETAFGVGMWEYCDRNPEFNNVFNESMASDSRMMSLVVKDCKEVFEGLNSLVDVGGGTGFVAKVILEAFPRIKCTVFDLPHVVADLPMRDNLTYVGGDMFHSIPSADAILFKSSDIRIDQTKSLNGNHNSILILFQARKQTVESKGPFHYNYFIKLPNNWCVLHNWSDDNCIMILKRCREAILGGGGKVMIIDIVIDGEKDESDITETKLVFDILMMVLVTGRERTEREWEKIFLEVGFSRYKITPIFGLRSLIEVFP